MPVMPESTTSTENTPSRAARFWRGVGLGTPIFLGYMPVGMAFGVLATTLGFSVLQSVTCSATALAGAGQFIALSLMRAGEAAIAVVAATTVINLRYVLFSATISPYLRGMLARNQAFLAFTLTDETFAVNISDRRQGLATGASMAGVGAIAWVGWVLGTLIGSVAAGWIGDPAAWGLDYAMPAMFTALFIALAENKRQVIVGLGAAAIMLVLPLLDVVGIDIPAAWHIVIAAMVAATAGAVFFDD
jgi:4-azaleucine resistance transporter AzlC